MNKKDLERKERHERWLVYYDSLYKALVQNQFEIGRQLVTLSTLAIGLLVGVFNAPESLYKVAALFVACSLFFTCIVCIMRAFYIDDKRVNAAIHKYYEESSTAPSRKKINNLENTIFKETKRVRRCTRISWVAFIAGIMSTVTVVLINIGPNLWKGI